MSNREIRERITAHGLRQRCASLHVSENMPFWYSVTRYRVRLQLLNLHVNRKEVPRRRLVISPKSETGR